MKEEEATGRDEGAEEEETTGMNEGAKEEEATGKKVETGECKCMHTIQLLMFDVCDASSP